jgi:hypothetical protein
LRALLRRHRLFRRPQDAEAAHPILAHAVFDHSASPGQPAASMPASSTIVPAAMQSKTAAIQAESATVRSGAKRATSSRAYRSDEVCYQHGEFWRMMFGARRFAFLSIKTCISALTSVDVAASLTGRFTYITRAFLGANLGAKGALARPALNRPGRGIDEVLP